MGWESGVTLGFGAVQGFNKMAAGQDQAKATVQQGEQVAQNEADTTVRKIGSLESSFTHGGIALDSMGPQAIFQQAAKQGYTNIGRTIENTNTESQNYVNAARTSSLESIASGFTKIGANKIDSTVSDLWQGSWLQDAWHEGGQDVGSMLDPSPTGPYLPFGTSR